MTASDLGPSEYSRVQRLAAGPSHELNYQMICIEVSRMLSNAKLLFFPPRKHYHRKLLPFFIVMQNTAKAAKKEAQFISIVFIPPAESVLNRVRSLQYLYGNSHLRIRGKGTGSEVAIAKSLEDLHPKIAG